MREIVLDTETTGLDPSGGHRIVEIACVEIINLMPTGQNFHTYLDPLRSVPAEAFRIHGLSTEFLRGKPLFETKYRDFLEFIADSRLIIHNAEFDIKFINAELARVGATGLSIDRVFDTLTFARKKHPGASNSLDALCARYRIDNSKRTKHGALLDSEILAEIYMELMGGRQKGLGFVSVEKKNNNNNPIIAEYSKMKFNSSIPLPAELAAHDIYRKSLCEGSVWESFYKVLS